MNKFRSNILAILSAAFCMASSAAFALDCPNPNIHDNDTVIKFGTNGSGSAQGVLGTKGSLGGKAQNAGAVYFDYNSGQLKICNGAAWVPMGPPVSAASTFPIDAVWTTSGVSGTIWTVPFDTSGRYTATLEAFGGGPCFIDIQRPNGSWVEVATKGNDSYLHAGFLIAKIDSPQFRVAQQFHDAYHPPSGPESQELHNGNLTGWKGINDMNWNGKMRVRSASYSCSVNFKIWRTS